MGRTYSGEDAGRGTSVDPGTGHRRLTVRSRLMPDGPRLVVREMQLAEVGMRIDYFHNSTDEYLQRLGVDRASLMSPEEWASVYRHDYARPIEQRDTYSLVWELDGRPVGFSSTDRIVFGQEAFMHLHIVVPDLRREGLGAEFVETLGDDLLPGPRAPAPVL